MRHSNDYQSVQDLREVNMQWKTSILQFQSHTPCWAASLQSTQCTLCLTWRMHSSACPWHIKATLYLPLDGKTWRKTSRDNWIYTSFPSTQNSSIIFDKRLHENLDEYLQDHLNNCGPVCIFRSMTCRYSRRPQETCYSSWLNLATECLVRRSSFVKLRSSVYGT